MGVTKKVRGREKFSKYKIIIQFISKCFSFLPKKIRLKLFEFFRMKKGISGMGIRYILLKTLTEKCGDNVSIHPGVYIFNPDKLIIGNNVSIHPMSYIDATGKIIIGNDVSIAHSVTIMSTTHKYDNVTKQIKNQEIVEKTTMISNNVWIGAKAVILAGKNIATGTVVAAGGVVTKDTKPNSVVGGVPAKSIKDRLQ